MLTWQEWRAYAGGILDPGNCEEPQDHAMSIVGYGSEANGDKFWLLKNSWGDHLLLSLPACQHARGACNFTY